MQGRSLTTPRRPGDAAVVAMLVLAVGTAVGSLYLPTGETVRTALVNAANVVAWALAGVVFVGRARREPATGRGWRLLAVAAALQSLYQVPPLLAFATGRPPPASPNLSDALVALMMPLILAGLISWSQGPRTARQRVRTALDAAIFSLSCFCIFWLISIGDSVAASHLSSIEKMCFVWPLLAMTGALGMILYVGADRPALLRGTLGCFGLVLGGVVAYQYAWVILGLRGDYYVGHPVDVGMTVLAAGVIGSARLGGPLRVHDKTRETPAVFGALAACVPALGVLAGDALRGQISGPLLVMEIVIALLFMARQLVTLWEVQQLSVTLEGRVAERTQALEASHAALLRAEKMEAVGRLAGGIAHDFNNLLTVIMGHSEVLQRSFAASDPRIERTTEISSTCERAADLTRQLLSFAKNQPTAPQVRDAIDLVAGMVRLLRRLVGEDVTLQLTPTSGPMFVDIDPSQFEQVMANLVVNARDALPAGGTVTVGLSSVIVDDDQARRLGSAAGSFVQLTIRDTGVGMDESTQARVFDPFFTTKAPGRGTGLGLATCHGIVSAAGGHILLDSAPGRGTTFRVRLPEATGQAQDIPAAPAAPAPTPGHETVLVAEDDDAVRGLVVAALRDSGYRVLVADNGEEAIACARAFDGAIALLLTDTVMPKMNGPAAARTIQSERPAIRVLSMSGHAGDNPALDDLRRAGAHFIGKPFTPAQICEKVREVLEAPV